MSEERLEFKAEVSRLLDIVAKSLYSHREVFLRELISNASDACDRLRYAALTVPDLAGSDADYKIRLSVDKDAGTLTIADNGIGMGRAELVENLGTIARSGTLAFLDQLSGDAKKDVSQIGQFGVGFYSAFMVADRVTVLTRKAGDAEGWRWESDGQGAFTIADEGGLARGTRVILHLTEDAKEFLDPQRLRTVVTRYSDHIPIPIVMAGKTEDGAAQDDTLNRASALWIRPKSEVTAEQYTEFYHHVAHAFDDPWLTLHYRAEGVLEYAALLFVPTRAPFDLYQPDRKHQVKLYVRRVFVTDEAEGLMPPYLRFVRGVIDSEDLPLNVSREMLQSNPMVTKIRQGVTKRILSELTRKAKDEAEGYAQFWEAFGPVLKEGVYEESGQRDTLMPLLRFRSTGNAAGEPAWVDLDGYVERMRPGQDAIYYITGDDADALRRSPHLEGFAAKGVEVLLLTDPVDEFWVPAVGTYKDKPLKSVTRTGSDLSKIEAEDGKAEPEAPTPPANIDRLVAVFKDTLKDAVKDVRTSERLTDSPVCLVADEGDMDIHLERLLKQHKQLQQASPRILEVNPGHPLIAAVTRTLEGDGSTDQAAELAWLLLDQARIIEGDAPPDPTAFSRRLTKALERGLAG